MVDAGAKARAADLLVLIGGLRGKVNALLPAGVAVRMFAFALPAGCKRPLPTTVTGAS
jgi:hypothetical protein